ncbi:MAG TPA: histidine phosphatase family protein [Euzebyales bacterium]
MPTLQVLRHAQAQPFARRDHDRRLTPDGAADARAVGKVVAASGVPDLALTSTARRAVETLQLAMDGGGWETDVTELDALYGAAPDEVFSALATTAGRRETVLIVGHEPWCSGLVGVLTGAQVRMATATLAVMEVGPGWDGIDPSWCSLTTLVPSWVAGRVSDVTSGASR